MIGYTFGSSYCQGQGAEEKLILLMDVIKDKGMGGGLRITTQNM